MLVASKAFYWVDWMGADSVVSMEWKLVSYVAVYSAVVMVV